jgi:hypothetical protein
MNFPKFNKKQKFLSGGYILFLIFVLERRAKTMGLKPIGTSGPSGFSTEEVLLFLLFGSIIFFALLLILEDN